MELKSLLSGKTRSLDDQVEQWKKINEDDDERLRKLEELDNLKKRHAQSKRKERTYTKGKFNALLFMLVLGVVLLIAFGKGCI